MTSAMRSIIANLSLGSLMYSKLQLWRYAFHFAILAFIHCGAVKDPQEATRNRQMRTSVGRPGSLAAPPSIIWQLSVGEVADWTADKRPTTLTLASAPGSPSPAAAKRD